uniref:Protein TIC 214 n=2 Tax=Turpinia TaxID=125003 RepID=A0A7G8QB88_9ROSI|nr:hypothetical protein RF1 [Turpinia arguta]YP_009975046.1 hypothetical chloroplast RF1 [Turpinia montana]QNK04046.1 hypothetical chloroplast RF1 [Turpinia montana]QNV47265.1 hypothetical protein RF1 [Turpinia arguta]
MIFPLLILGNLLSLCMKIINLVVVVGLYYGFRTTFSIGNLVSLCMKIINSVVVVGLYYGFLTTFSIGPSYLFLLRARVMEEGEEGTEKKVSATTGFIAGQLMIFISIYYAPLHLALGRPHTITVLALPYLLFHFFWNNHKHFFDYGSTTRNSMRNLSIQCVFLNNLIFQLFNHFILPSSILARLVNISMFRCNNKMLFVTSSFVGWLIGHIFFMKWIRLVLVWIQQNNSIRSNVLIRSNKYLVSELRNSMARIFSILLFITCVYYLGRIPSPILTKKLKETSETEERGESEEETDIEIETTSETRGTKQEQEGSTEEDPSPYLDKDKEDKYLLWFEKPVVILLLDYKRWNRPLRYIKNNRFENTVRNGVSQYFFYPYLYRSAGKERISFTYPPSLSTFLEMIQKKMSLFTKISFDELYNNWVYTNKQKKNNLSNEFINRIETLDNRSIVLDVLEKMTRLCNDDTKKEYLAKIYDPGPYRGQIKKWLLPSIINETSVKNNIEVLWINKIHGILLTTDYHKFESKIDTFDRKSLSIEKRLDLFPEHEQRRIGSEDRIRDDQIKIVKIFFDAVITDTTVPNDQTINNKKKQSIGSGIKEISKKVPKWSYKLIDELEQQERDNEEKVAEDHEIRSRKAKRVVIFTDKQQNIDTYTNTQDTNNPDQDQADEVALIRYSQQSDFRRDTIKGSVRAQRRKTVIWELFQANVHSPLFLDRLEKSFFFPFRPMKFIFRNWIGKNTEFKTSDYTKGKAKEIEKKEKAKREKYRREEKARIEIAEAWDIIIFAQVIRGSVLVTQSILRKYVILPSLIIAKNIARMLLFQFPEWSEDLKYWNREMHVKCTYNGVQLSETEFPQNWLTDGIQIKILFPFCLKPWHRSKLRFPDKDPIKKKGQKNDFCFLTVWGMETELPFGSPRNRRSFFEPIFKELKKKIRKLKTKRFLVIRVLKERTKIFLKVSKETQKWVIKSILFLKGIIKELSKRNPILLLGLKEIYELSETKKEKDSIIRNSNRMIHESSIQIRAMNLTNYSLTEKKMRDLTDKTITINNKIKKISKDKKKRFLIPEKEKKISSNKTSYHAKLVESPKNKNIWQILKRRNARLIRKSYHFFKFLIERIYLNILFSMMNSPRIHAQHFFESTKKNVDKYIYNNETNQERINKTNKNTIHFISTIKNPLSISNSSNNNSQTFCDLYSLSQAYVFYKLSQTQVINLYKLRSVLKYYGTSLCLKNEIKDDFGEQGIFRSKLRYRNLQTSEMNQWKPWLKGHYQYDLSQIRWSRLVPQKWRNRVSCIAQNKNKDLKKWDSYEKNRLIHYEKQNDFETDSLLNQKSNFKKHYRYNRLSYKFINYEDKRGSYTYSYGLPLQLNNKQKILYNYNINIHKQKIFDMLRGIPINNYLGEDDIMDMEKIPDRKYIESWITTDTNSNKKIKTGTQNYQIIEKIDKKGLFSLTIHQDQEINPSNQKRLFFDWMGMNEEILNRSISNLELWFFPEFVRLYSAYKIIPWIIPIKFFLFNFHEKVDKNITGKQKGDLSISSNEKKSLELENQNKEENELEGQRNLGSDSQNQGNLRAVLSNQEKNVDDDYAGSDMKKHRKKKKYKSNTEAELDFFLKRYLCFQLRWNDSLDQRMINNIKIYCLLLSLINPREIAISSIQRGEMSLDILMIQKDFTLTELMKRGILIIEPLRLSVKNDGQFIMYQTVGISLLHKSKHKMNQRYRERGYVDKKNFNESVATRQRMTGTRDKNHYDLLVTENVLPLRRLRELRTLILINSRNRNGMHRNPVFCNNIKNCGQVLDKSKHLNIDKNKLMKFKFFFWPNYRLEDLACMNRYWFNSNNGGRFSMIRIHMYPRLKMC